MKTNVEAEINYSKNFLIGLSIFGFLFLFMFLKSTYQNTFFSIICNVLLFVTTFISLAFVKDLIKSFMIFGLLKTFIKRDDKKDILNPLQRWVYTAFVLAGFSYFYMYTDLGTVGNIFTAISLCFFVITTTMRLMGLSLRDFKKQNTKE